MERPVTLLVGKEGDVALPRVFGDEPVRLAQILRGIGYEVLEAHTDREVVARISELDELEASAVMCFFFCPDRTTRDLDPVAMAAFCQEYASRHALLLTSSFVTEGHHDRMWEIAHGVGAAYYFVKADLEDFLVKFQLARDRCESLIRARRAEEAAAAARRAAEREKRRAKREVRRRRLAQAHAARVGILDPNTGLLNRNGFDRTLRKIRASTSSTTVASFVIADVDNLKLTNDILGHQVGDWTVRITVRALQEVFPESAPICRWGGDEFMVLLPGVANATARRMVRMLESRVDEELGDLPIPSGVTAGVSTLLVGEIPARLLGSSDERKPEFFTRADEELRQRKRTRRRGRDAGVAPAEPGRPGIGAPALTRAPAASSTSRA